MTKLDIDKSIKAKVAELLTEVRARNPLVHHITNYVTANDCANAVLAVGGSPVMADDKTEVEDIVSASSALVLNIGTPKFDIIDTMLIAGKRANKLGIPVVFDPVGAGASSYRNKIADRILNDLKLAVVRGNISEIKAISGIASYTRGVDAAENDALTRNNLAYGREIAKELSCRLNCSVAITGEIDIIAKGDIVYYVENGHKMLSRITGSGCMCTSLIALYCGIAKDYMEAAAAGVLTMGLAGEMAGEKTTHIEQALYCEKSNEYRKKEVSCCEKGTGTFRIMLMDALSCIKATDIEEKGRVYCSES